MKSYRGYKKESPMSSWGHAMFNDDATGLDGYGEILYSVEKTDLTDINDLTDEIVAKLEEAAETDEEIAQAIGSFSVEDLINPTDMIIDAGAYDNDVLFDWLWENIFEAKRIAGVATYNGAIVFDANLIQVEGIAAELEITQG